MSFTTVIHSRSLHEIPFASVSTFCPTFPNFVSLPALQTYSHLIARSDVLQYWHQSRTESTMLVAVVNLVRAAFPEFGNDLFDFAAVGHRFFFGRSRKGALNT